MILDNIMNKCPARGKRAKIFEINGVFYDLNPDRIVIVSKYYDDICDFLFFKSGYSFFNIRRSKYTSFYLLQKQISIYILREIKQLRGRKENIIFIDKEIKDTEDFELICMPAALYGKINYLTDNWEQELDNFFSDYISQA